MRKLFALFVLVCIFFPLAIGAMTLTSIGPWILDRAFYERIVGNDQIYASLLTDEMPNQFSSEVFDGVDQLPLRALNLALREVLTADYLHAQSLSVVNQVFDFIDGYAENFEITVDVAPIKATLMGEGGVRFAKTLAAALPSCDPGQEPIAPDGRLVRCMEASGSVEMAAEQITLALPTVLEDIPDLVRLNQSNDLNRDWSVGWLLGISIRQSLNFALFATIFTALAVGVVGAYLGADTLRGRLMWLASSLFVPAGLFVIMGFSISAPFVGRLLRSGMRFARWDSVEFTEAFEQTVTQIVLPIVKQIGSGFLVTGLVGCLIAFVLLVWSWNITTSEQPTVKMVEVPARKA